MQTQLNKWQGIFPQWDEKPLPQIFEPYLQQVFRVNEAPYDLLLRTVHLQYHPVSHQPLGIVFNFLGPPTEAFDEKDEAKSLEALSHKYRQCFHWFACVQSTAEAQDECAAKPVKLLHCLSEKDVYPVISQAILQAWEKFVLDRADELSRE